MNRSPWSNLLNDRFIFVKVYLNHLSDFLCESNRIVYTIYCLNRLIINFYILLYTVLLEV